MLRREERIYVLQFALRSELSELVRYLGGNYGDTGPCPAQELDLPSGDAAAADHEHRPISQLQKDGEVIHGAHGKRIVREPIVKVPCMCRAKRFV